MRRSAVASTRRAAVTASGSTEIEVMPKRTRCSANAGLRDGARPHSDEVIPTSRLRGDDLLDRPQHRRIALVEQLGEDLGVAIDTEHQLGQVVAADRHAGDPERGVVGDPGDHRGHLRHHPHDEPALASEPAGVDRLEAGLEFPRRPDERDHHLEVRELLADPTERLQFQRERLGILDVAVAPAVPDHRVLLDGLELLAAGETPELVRPEIHRAVHDRPGAERAGDLSQLRSHPADELVALAVRDQCPGVSSAERVDDHELAPEQPDPVHVERSHLHGTIGHRQIDVQLGRRHLGHGCERRRATFHAVRDHRREVALAITGEHLPRSGVDRDDVTVAQRRRGDTGADDRRQPQLAAHDRRVAGAATGVGDERRRAAHDGHPVG